jgi:hypothetical protein
MISLLPARWKQNEVEKGWENDVKDYPAPTATKAMEDWTFSPGLVERLRWVDDLERSDCLPRDVIARHHAAFCEMLHMHIGDSCTPPRR